MKREKYPLVLGLNCPERKLPGASLSGEDAKLSPPLEQADPSEHGFFCYTYNDKIPNLKSPKDTCDYVSDFGMRFFYVKA